QLPGGRRRTSLFGPGQASGEERPQQDHRPLHGSALQAAEVAVVLAPSARNAPVVRTSPEWVRKTAAMPCASAQREPRSGPMTYRAVERMSAVKPSAAITETLPQSGH